MLRRLVRAALRQPKPPPKKYVHSHYLRWLNFANAGILEIGHWHLMDLAVRELPTDDPVLEIGSFAGQSTNVLAYFLRQHSRPNPLFTVDPWQFEDTAGLDTIPESEITFASYRNLVRDQFLQNVRFWSGDRLPHTIEATSDDFFAAWAAGEERVDVFERPVRLGGPLSFAFIDGGHTYEQARRDFENVDRQLVPGGFVLLDDSTEEGPFPGVFRVAREALAAGYELADANPNHLLRKPLV